MVNLNGSNYHIWRSCIVKKMHLRVYASNKLESMNNDDWALWFVAISDNVLKIMLGITCQSLWDKLVTLYALKTVNN